MHRPLRHELVVLLLLTLFLTAYLSPRTGSFATLPDQHRLTVGDPLEFRLNLPRQVLRRIMVSVEKGPTGLLQLDGVDMTAGVYGLNQTAPVAVRPGKVVLRLKLFGVIPLKQVAVDVLPEIKVWPGGHSIGVVLQTLGVTVVGFSEISGEDGKEHNPAKDAGIQVGDVILAVNGQRISTDKEALSLVKAAAQGQVNLRIRRGAKEFEVRLNPVLCLETSSYRLGLLIREGAAGVGTLTFYDPQSKIFGALGHVITDAESSRRMDVTQGRIVMTSVQGVHSGRKGQPGEKVGSFADQQELSGTITRNTQVGIFGKLESLPKSNVFPGPISVGFARQIREGPAEMLTVINGDQIERFAIAIERIMPQKLSGEKGMVVRITDPRLLAVAGGIVQGMSGSPIIQDGRLVGAVTHVFVNDPTRGYGVLAEWMLMQTDIWKQSASRAAFRGDLVFPNFFCRFVQSKIVRWPAGVSTTT